MKRFSILRICFFFAFVNAGDHVFSSEHFLAPHSFSFWVSPHGNDASTGTQQDPFLTLKRARDAVRALPSSAFKQHDVYIFIEKGTYRLEQPLVLRPIDSGKEGHNVIYRAASGAHPVISGAIKVTDWSLYDASLGIYRAYVGPCKSRQLYVNGRRAVRARTTLYPAGFLPSWTNGGIEFIPTSLNPTAWQDPSTWTNPQDIEAVALTQWKMMRVPIDSIRPYNAPSNGLIILQEPAWTNANVYWDQTTMLPGKWSFWQVAWFENAYEFLTQPGQWYLDRKKGWLYYIPLPGEDLKKADVELPLLETLIEGKGSLEQPIHNIRFEGLTFSYATWLLPSSKNGYISDQSGQLLVGHDHKPNFIGHDQHVVPTPGNLSFRFAHSIVFYGNIFEHLGAVGLEFGTGSKNNTIDSNLFTDISSAALTLGAVTIKDAHPSKQGYVVEDNLVTNNLIRDVANEYVDAAGIFVGFTSKTTISHNTIVDVPWSGIAVGWGWGLLDVGSFPGLPNASVGEWGTFKKPTPNRESAILYNEISDFINILWDGGAIYTSGQQGPSLSKGLLIKGNVAFGKRPSGGGNTIYTDGGSRYIKVEQNASYDNPIGITFVGSPPQIGDPFFFQYPLYYLENNVPFGSDSGGCVTYGDIKYVENYWLEVPILENEASYNTFYFLLLGFYPYSTFGFFNICPFTLDGVSYPINLRYKNNHVISSKEDIPHKLLSNAGVQKRPHTIPKKRWVLP